MEALLEVLVLGCEGLGALEGVFEGVNGGGCGAGEEVLEAGEAEGECVEGFC